MDFVLVLVVLFLAVLSIAVAKESRREDRLDVRRKSRVVYLHQQRK